MSAVRHRPALRGRLPGLHLLLGLAAAHAAACCRHRDRARLPPADSRAFNDALQRSVTPGFGKCHVSAHAGGRLLAAAARPSAVQARAARCSSPCPTCCCSVGAAGAGRLLDGLWGVSVAIKLVASRLGWLHCVTSAARGTLPRDSLKFKQSHVSPTRSDGAAGDVFSLLKASFDAGYRGNRAPFPLFVHSPYLEDNLEAVTRFVGGPSGCACAPASLSAKAGCNHFCLPGRVQHAAMGMPARVFATAPTRPLPFLLPPPCPQITPAACPACTL